jgi:hypothetical protein
MNKKFRDRLFVSIKRTAEALIGTLSISATAVATENITVGFDMSTGQPIADVLTSPEAWIYLGTQYIPNKL